MRKILIRAAGAAALLTALTLTACGGGKPTVSFDLTGNDQMKYSQTRLETSAPMTITINFENVGKMPKTAMGHNVVVLKPGTDPVAFSAKCLENGGSLENNHLPEAVMGDVVASTKLLGPGEKDSLTFTAEAAATYPYVCTFTAHAAAGMKGEIVVK